MLQRGVFAGAFADRNEEFQPAGPLLRRVAAPAAVIRLLREADHFNNKAQERQNQHDGGKSDKDRIG